MMLSNEDTDWTKEDKGGFKHPETIGDLSYADLEARVLKAIDAKFRTLPRIKEHAGLERSFDLTELVEGMELDRIISRYDNGTITAFFRYEQRPTRFWLSGDRTVEAEFDEKYVPSKPRETEAEFNQRMKKPHGRAPIEIDPVLLEEAAAKHADRKDIAEVVGIGVSTMFAKIKTDKKLRDAFDRGRQAFAKVNYPEKSATVPTEAEKPIATPPHQEIPDVQPREPKAEEPVKRRQIKPTAEKIEELTARLGSKTRVGTVLGYAKGYGLTKFMQANPEMQKAYERGLAKFVGNDEDVAAEIGQGTEEPKTYKDFTPAEIKQISSVEPSLQAIARAVDIGQAVFSRWIKDNPTIRAAYDRGRAEYREKNPVSTKPKAKPETEEVKETVRNPLEAEPEEMTKKSLLEPVRHPTHIGLEIEQPAHTESQVKSVAITGAVLHIGFKGDLFAMPRRDRDLLNDIVDLVQRHEETNHG